ncbi:hypothetical protein MUY27_06140 [Mucilaginibacter sp. RS28]|uniref:Uncharacterized protein n=1 Tax=Mucilaginibacter straminoryzae TaxID=2932774 RepID=A0A9X2B924_9SPHI|nr:hypothetical protein [Mucilaginibacter straminoryzae]MCJ8209280.1 hypothetical protein [Mucilaginibacter straminoryzae]
MKKRIFNFYYLYLIAGILLSISVVLGLTRQYPNSSYTGVIIDAILAIAMLYLSYKSYHERKDRELM